MFTCLQKVLTTVGICALLLTATPTLSQAAQVMQEDPPAIQLEMGSFIPNQSPLPLDPELIIGAYEPGELGYYLVQFTGPVVQQWKDEITAAGAQVLSYVPEYAFKVRMTPEQATQVEAVDGVHWVGIFQPAYKLDLSAITTAAATDDRMVYQVAVEEGANTRAIGNALIAQGITVLNRQNNTLLVNTNLSEIKTVARQMDVAWIERFQFAELHNEYGGGNIMGANTLHANGYTGKNQVIGVADSGFDRGQAIELFPDVPNQRIRAIFNWPGAPGGCVASIVDDGAQDVASGHGTHVVASALGKGNALGIGRGVAPDAELVFQALENYAVIKSECGGSAYNGYALVGIPNDTRLIFDQAYTAGARIHNNSWGASANGAYTTRAQHADDFIYQHPDMTIVFSAGNSGVDANRDGVVDASSIGSPGSAKNVLTVGASENDRRDGYPCDSALTYPSYENGQSCAQMGGTNFLGSWGSSRFPAEPLRSDPSAGNAEQMAAFSSRGPTQDQRIKPDIVAPGTWILSGYSDLYQEGYNTDPVNPQNSHYQHDGDGLPYSEHYKYFSGTSMSAPLVAGGVALVREFYQDASGHAHNPSAALLKATLINSAVDMLDENNDGVSDNRYPIPNIHEGWGRVNLVSATDGSHEFVDDRTGVATGNAAAYRYTLPGDHAVKITLVWNDVPGNPAAGPDLVNNLDLVVTSPGAVTYRGNHFGGGWSLPGGQADRVNNVENIYVQSAEAGIWTIEVKGTNVPFGPQPFALVVDYEGEDERCIITGDINCDHAANIVDLQVEINMILRSDNPDYTLYPQSWWNRGDFDRNNVWNIVDLQQLINIIVGGR